MNPVRKTVKGVTTPLPIVDAPFQGFRTPIQIIGPAFCIAGAAILLILPRGGLVHFPEVAVAWCTAILTLLPAIWLTRAMRSQGANPWASAMCLTAAYYFYRYGVGALVIYYWDRFPWELSWMEGRFFQQGARLNLSHACHMALLGGFGLALGFHLPPSFATLFPRLRWSINTTHFQRRFLFWAPLTLIAALATASLPDSLRVLNSIAASVMYLMTIIAAFWLFRAASSSELAKWTGVVLLLCGFSFPLGLLTGQIGNMVAPFVMVAFGYLLARGRLPWKATLAVAAVSILFVFPFLTVYKAATYGERLASVEDRVAHTRNSMELLGRRAATELTMDRFVARMAAPFLPAVYSHFYPDIYPYEMGRTFYVQVLTLVPRILWPEKPSMSIELNRYSAFVGLIREHDGTSMVFDAITEYYVNFGLPGVFFLSVLHGFYLKVFTTWISGMSNELIGGVLNLCLFMSNPEFAGFGQAILLQTRLVPIVILLLYLLSRTTQLARTSHPARYYRRSAHIQLNR